MPEPEILVTPFKVGFIVAMIEGEGSIGLHKHNAAGSGYNKCDHLDAKVGAYNTNRKILERLREMANCGAVRKTRHTKPSTNQKEMFYWVVQKNADVKRVLLMIKPYLIIKKRQCELLLEYLHLRETTPRGTRATGSKRNPREWEICNEMLQLNKRGII